MASTAERLSAPWARGMWALGFVVVCLAALVAVPSYYRQRVSVIQDRIAQVLEPAARESAELRLIKARQMARMERFLATGDRALRLEYVSAIAAEDSAFSRLRALSDQLDQDVRTRLAQLASESADWRFLNSQVFATVIAGDTLATGARQQIVDGYDDLQRVARELDLLIRARADGGRQLMSVELARQSRIMFALGFLALVATLIVGRVAYRYRSLTIEREQRRREAVRARREIDALLEATGDGVLGIDLSGTCISLNRAGSQLLGYPEGEIIGRDVHDTLFHTRPDGTPAVRDESELIRAIAEGRPLESPQGAIMWRRKRDAFPARWSLRPMIDGRVLRGAVLTFTDMTETMRRERALRRAVKQREDVVSIVSHDLRNPLGVAMAAAELLIDLPLDEVQRRRQAEIIQRSAGRMHRLIEDLLDVSRIEGGGLLVRLSREDLHPILEEAREHFAHQAEAKGLALVLEAAVGDTEARVDRDRIHQALSNLLDNAIRVTPEGGRIVLSVAEEGDEVRVAVEDTGPGIDPALVDTLFDRFAQSEGSDRGAAGLGLTIVRGVAAAHGGVASVETELGRGSRFELRVPKEGPPPGSVDHA